MKPAVPALLAALLIAGPPLARAQPSAPSAGGPGTQPSASPAASPPSGSLASGSPASGPPAAPLTAPEMVANTLARDINTASYYELVTWCDELGLDDSGSRKELQARLASHFKVTLPQAPAPGQRSITVRSARQSQYYTQEETGEKYVLLRGDVVVEVRDTKDNTLQLVKAASLTFNQTRRTISAVGNVSYALTRNGQTDTFTGESLDFNLDSSEAVFYDGATRRTIKGTNGDVTYTFDGQTITRVSNDTVILQKGGFTSSDPSDPLYQIRAGTIWLLAPGEWAVQDAVLLIGRVPILYLPGFFWPGDEFFFNPNIGYKTREGSFLQTTTYLVGRKQKQDSPFSFLQLNESGDSGYALEPHGLFLRKIPGTIAPKDDGHTLKLMADAYSRLGLMAGVAGDYSPLGTFRASLARSRSIFLDSSSQLYTPYLPVSNPPYQAGDEFWNDASLFGLSVPVRFGLEGTFKTSSPTAAVNATFQYFSDPSYTTDFYTRSESGVLSALFTQPTAASATTPQQTSLTWDVSGNVDFTKAVNQPFIQNLSMSNFDLKANWQSYSPSALSDPQASDPGSAFYYPTSVTAPSVSMTMSGDIVSLSTNTKPAQAPAAAGTTVQPSSTVPSSAPAPAQAASSAPGAPAASAAGAPAAVAPAQTPGTASSPAGSASPASSSSSSAASSAPAQPTPDPGKGIRPPVASPTPAASTQAVPVRIPFRGPDAQASVAPAAAVEAATFKLSYQVQPRATLEHTFDTTGWTSRESVDYAILYRTFETGGTSSVTAASTFWNNLADTSLTLSADGLWRYRFDPSSAERASTDWTNQLLEDQQQDKLALRSAFQSTVRPFPAITELSTSNVQYKINARMYQIGLTGTDPYSPIYTTLGPAWSSEAISEHSLASTLALVTPATSDSLALTFQLPPLIPTMTGRLDAAYGIAKGSVQGGLTAPDNAPVTYQPLVVTAAVDTGKSQRPLLDIVNGVPAPPAFSASEELQFDVGGSVLTRSTSTLGFGGLSGTFVAQNTGTPNRLDPSTAKIGYEAAGDPVWYWKDRIKVTPGLKTHWYVNLQNHLDNLFDFGPSLTLTIYKNLDLTFSSLSNNTRTYLYIPGWSDQPWVNPLTDLLRSFNFANNDDRRRSGFKIQSISLKAVQHFPDWDVSVQYTGSPQLITHTTSSGAQYVQNEWSPTFSILVQWNAISEIKSTIHQEYTGTTTVPSLR